MTSAVIVRLVNGKASLYNNSAGTVDLYADAVGYYSGGGSTFLPVGPQRVLDTRSGLGGSGQTVLPHAAAVTPVTNVPALAGANVTAVALEVTVTGAQQAGSLTVFPDLTKLPTAPSLRFAANRGVTGFMIVPVVNGNIDFYDNSGGNIQVLADLVGYYSS